MSAEDLKFICRAIEAFNQRDAEWVVAHSSPDIAWYPAIVGGVEVEPFRGHDGVREFFRDLDEVWEQFELEPEELRDLGGHVLVLSQVHASGKAGVELKQSLDALWEIRDGKIANGRSYLNRDDALTAAQELTGQAVRE
jgi:ketosteroid isomerase-like protein